MTTTFSFGYWLRRRRKAMDLTQAALAQQVCCAVVTIKKIEADERRPSRVLADRLATLLAIPADERAVFLLAARAERGPEHLAITAAPVGVSPSQLAPQRLHNFPAPTTTLIGRELEMATICRLVRHGRVRLLSLTGPGGTGKTRLALLAAAELANDFADGAVFVELASISDPELVAPTIARALGVREIGVQSLIEGLKSYLRERQTMLLLDNFEQVLDAARIVAELLSAAPRLKVLVTSRVPLHLQGEHEFAVQPLDVPDRTQPHDLHQLAQCEAVRLFLERARAIKTSFTLTDENAQTIAEICRRLDGLPLAIELAAARSKLFSPPALLSRLEHRLDVLTGGPRDAPARQQSLRNTIDWSYNLLLPHEQRLFAGLAVFVGGCSLEAAEAVCNVDGLLPFDVADGLEALLNHSLLQPVEGVDGEPRLTMLETIREYALERLAQTSAAELARRQHAEYYLALVEDAAPKLHGAEQLVWLDRLEAEHDNARAALVWCRAGGHAETGLKIAHALWPFWRSRGYASEGRTWIEGALAQSDETPTVERTRALIAAADAAWRLGDIAHATLRSLEGLEQSRMLDYTRGIAAALRLQGQVAHSQSDYARASACVAESVALFRVLGDKNEIAATVSVLGRIMLATGDHVRAAELFDEDLAISRALENAEGVLWSLLGLGDVALTQRKLAQAEKLYNASLLIARERQQKTAIASLLVRLGEVSRGLNNYPEARALYEESLRQHRDLNDRRGIASDLHNQGYVAQHEGDHHQALNLFRQSLDLFWELGDKRAVIDCLAGIGGSLGVQEQHTVATRLLSAAEALLAQHGAYLDYADQIEHERNAALVRAQLDEVAFAAAWSEGQTMTLEQAMAYALDKSLTETA